jgi:hypothetical protein
VRFKTWPVVAVALTGLLLVVVVSVMAIRTKAQAIYSELDALNDRHRQVESRLRRLRGDVHLSGIFLTCSTPRARTRPNTASGSHSSARRT